MVNPFDCIPDAEFAKGEDALEFLLESDSLQVEGVILDLDGVLMEVDGTHPPPELGVNVRPETVQLVDALAAEVPVCIVTNRIKHDDFAPADIEAVFGVPVVRGTAPKPSEAIFWAALADLGVDRSRAERVVMVGDSSYYDIYGAGRAGLTTFQVEHDLSSYPPHQRLGKSLADTTQTLTKLVDRSYRAARK